MAWRIEQRAANEIGPPARMPPPLSRLPWDLAKDEFGAQGADFIGALGRLLVRGAKDEMRPQPMDILPESGGLLGEGAKDEIGVVAG
jgi:hypothetical protein